MAFWKRLVPGTLRSGGYLRSVYTLHRGLVTSYGWGRSFRERQCVDAAGQPIPWFTYPAIDYLSQFDYSGQSVFEWGCGNSTLFWSRLGATRVVGAEYDPDWYAQLKARLPAGCEVIKTPRDLVEYIAVIRGRGLFDVIVVDGSAESRLACAREAVHHLTPTGLVVLDDADMCPLSADFLRSTDRIQIDFTGFGPHRVNVATTSLFLPRNFAPKPRGRQPAPKPSSSISPWDGV